MKYKVGDRVKCIKKIDCIKVGYKGTVIDGASDESICVEFDEFIGGHSRCGKGKSGHCWWLDGTVHVKKIPLITSKIVITTDGAETLARLYEDGKVVKSATAKCAPEFDFNIGARLAFDRLIGEEKTSEKWRVVHRPVRVGDSIRLKETIFTFNRVGDILKVANVSNSLASVKACDHPQNTDAYSDYLWHYPSWCYEVIESCTAEKKEQYYNGKVVCVKAGEIYAYTAGKIYEFKDGNVKNDNGFPALCERIKTLDEWHKKHSYWAEFIPLVEEKKGE